KSILIPVATSPAAQPAVQAAVRIVSQLNCPSGVFTLVHVGDKKDMPEVRLPELPGWSWNTVVRTGNVVDVIIETALETKANLIALTTEGRHGFLDALRGSYSERILEKTPCPLLAIPASGFMASVV
ncbi:MAG TPA: universal stress protein, partial [Nitrospira sp.]|nr:universal stress protein [Nitrospira sp.]